MWIVITLIICLTVLGLAHLIGRYYQNANDSQYEYWLENPENTCEHNYKQVKSINKYNSSDATQLPVAIDITFFCEKCGKIKII